MKYKVGDKVIGVKNVLHCPNLQIVNIIGKIAHVDFNDESPYRIEFESRIDFDYSEGSPASYYAWFSDENIRIHLTKYKLKKLLED